MRDLKKTALDGAVPDTSCTFFGIVRHFFGRAGSYLLILTLFTSFYFYTKMQFMNKVHQPFEGLKIQSQTGNRKNPSAGSRRLGKIYFSKFFFATSGGFHYKILSNKEV